MQQVDPATLMYSLPKPIIMKSDKGNIKVELICARLVDARGEFV